MLNNGVKMPLLGFGVYMMTDLEECEKSVLHAIETGYRLLDTSSAYFNEEAVGRAIKKSGIPREELFVTTKLWIQDAGYENAKAGFETSLQKLGLDYLDLYLIHQPCGDCYGSWRAMTELYQEGRIRAIGVCNFNSDRLVDFVMNNELPPAINQVEFHPYFQQKKAEEIMRECDVQMEAWSPLGHGGKGILENDVLVSIGKRYGKTPAQIILRWDIERGIATIPKSVRKERIEENFDVFDFHLTTEEITAIDQLDRNDHIADLTDVELIKKLNQLKVR